MLIPDLIFTHPGSWIPGSRIQKREQKRGVKKKICHTFFCSHKFHKIVHYFVFEKHKKKIWANFQWIIELLTQKMVTKLSKIWVWDPGSVIGFFPDPGYRGKNAPDPGSRSATLNKGETTSNTQKTFLNSWRGSKKLSLPSLSPLPSEFCTD